MDPTATGETRDQKLEAYRQARDQIIERLIAKFGAPKEVI
jgi:arsenate reductase